MALVGRGPETSRQYLEDTKENKMIGPIERQIAIHADEPEQLSASELLSILIKGIEVLINDEYYSLYEITDKLIGVELRVAVEESLTDNKHAIQELYIKQINEMMEY